MPDQVLKSYHAQWTNEAYNRLAALDVNMRHQAKTDLSKIRKLYIEAMELRVKLKGWGLDVLIPVEQQLVAADRQLKAMAGRLEKMEEALGEATEAPELVVEG